MAVFAALLFLFLDFKMPIEHLRLRLKTKMEEKEKNSRNIPTPKIIHLINEMRVQNTLSGFKTKTMTHFKQQKTSAIQP